MPASVLFLCPDANGDGIDSWIIVSCALVMAAGTPGGGWRIVKTLGHKMVKLHPSTVSLPNEFGDNSFARRAVRHARIAHAQHLDRHHGCGLCQVPARVEVDGD
ncbi:hypothetical protein ABIE78_003210 [Sinorhizobium fredii]|uniref:inorganic phosphate transporter n=1 Tax=Rhizobium fredii TaxID=380 RepID=UPI0002F74F79|nr:inorganic phosphate transporter [Sinorhizobium fredii]